TADVHLRKLLRGQSLHALDLRNDLVASPLNAETIDVIPAQQGGKILPRLTEVNALCAQLVAVEDNFGLRLVIRQIRVGEDEDAAGHRLLHKLVGERDQLLRLAGGSDHEIDGEVSAARKSWRREWDHPDAGNFRQRAG